MTAIIRKKQENGGAILFNDTEYNSTSRQIILANTPTVIKNNGVNALKVIDRDGVGNWLDNNKFKPPNGNNDTYTWRFSATFRLSVANAIGTIGINIGGNQGNIYPKSIEFNQDAGVDFEETFEFSLFAGDTFFQNGGELIVNFPNQLVEIYGTSFLLINTNKA
jgi:hypothetical protein